MADVELGQLRDGGDGDDIVERQPVPGVRFDPVLRRQRGHVGDPLQFRDLLLAARMGSGQPKVGEGFELEVIAACVLGGVSLTGGVGRMSFVVAGVLIMGVVQNAMSLKNINFDWQYVVRGSVLMAAVLFDRLKQRGR